MSEWVIYSKNEQFAHFWWVTWAICSWLLIFGERPEQFAHITHDKRGNEEIALFYVQYKKRTKNTISVKFFDWIAHLSWATWANCSRSLICHEWPEQFTHSCSFNISDLSDSLTVAYLFWAIWANHSQMLIWFEQSERMSKFPALEKFDFAVCSRLRSQNFMLGQNTFYTPTIFFQVRSVHP